LFTFRRTASASNSSVQVLREYSLPAGKLAATERVVYEAGKLVSYQLDEAQSGARAKVIVKSNSKDSPGAQIVFNYTQGDTKKTGTEKLQKDTLINDMVAPFITNHWSDLMKGSTVKLRLIAPSRAETVGFRLFKESETIWKEKPVVIVRLEPASVIIAQFI